MLKKLLSFAGWAMLLCIILLISVVITIWLDESLYLAIILWLAQLLILLIFRAAWSGVSLLWKKRNLSRFYAPLQFSRLEQVLYEHWRSGSAVIKRISRKRRSVPWFLLMGERCGKTTLMASARLPIMSHQPENEQVVPTRTLRWWFFKTGGFLDISSYFLHGKPAAKAAWLKLANWCGKITAPAGVVVCVSCRDLQTKSVLELHQQARQLRTQLEPVMRSVRRRLPIYVVLTECDKLDGFTLWANKLSEQQRQQALGYSWRKAPVADRQDMTLLDPMFASLKQGIDMSRLSMMTGALPDASLGAMLNFSHNLSLLQGPLHHYVAALCEPDAYFASGSLAGIWLTASVERPQQHQTRDALFVQELLSQVLPENSTTRVPEAFGKRQQWLDKWAIPALTGVLTCALLFSAWETRQLMVPVKGNTLPMLAQGVEYNEKWMSSPLRYTPFIPLLRQRHTALETEIAVNHNGQVNDIYGQLKAYRREFYGVEPQQQRQMILALAQSILTRHEMLKGLAVEKLVDLPRTPDALRLISAPENLSEKEQLVLERAILRYGNKTSGTAAMQLILKELVNSDPKWRWLIADDSQLNSLSLTHFWPHSDSNKALSGIWLEEGQRVITQHIALIQQASGEEQTLPVFSAFWEQWSGLKQDAWLAFLLVMARHEALLPGQKATSAQLMAIAKGQDPVAEFMRSAQRELADVRENEAHPWLAEMRRINVLQRSPGRFSWLESLDDKEKSLRSALRRMVRGDATMPVVNSGDVASWQQWRGAVEESVNQAIATHGHSPALTQGLFNTGVVGKPNPLNTLWLTYTQLRKQMELPENNIGRGAVWALLESQLNTLTANAMATSACWIEENWQSKVLQPLGNRAEQRDPKQQQEKAWRYVSDFLQESAINVMKATAMGLRAGDFHGHSIPFTSDFMQVVNYVVEPDDLALMPEREQTRTHDEISRLEEQISLRETQLASLEKKALTVEVASLPATIPGGARLMPVGTRLDLHCATGSSQLDSGNLREEARFNWSPNQCNAVTLTVKFPGADIKHRYFGDSAWTDFLADFDQGERAFALDEFEPAGVQSLKDLAIEKVLVRFGLRGQQTVQAHWQQWKSLNDEVETLKALREEQLERQRSRQQPGYFQGKLATLPTSVAMCVN